jgi:hypothetical protein
LKNLSFSDTARLNGFFDHTGKINNAVIEDTMAVLLQHGLTADHAKILLGRTIQLLEWGKQAANPSPQANA